MLRSLVGSEMCIRDRPCSISCALHVVRPRCSRCGLGHNLELSRRNLLKELREDVADLATQLSVPRQQLLFPTVCLLYTSDAADEEDSVDNVCAP
eukprot:TRINITY_DN63371_c0_g1_i1.p1 TRINITY_DN63371_c0_g1~~TRINITY_DN63371_c0_g1_i1.p1  ORF type:complete len:106 (-),score=35.23 TRINITY_DN63371_c0_g1_i1:11-295(-)